MIRYTPEQRQFLMEYIPGHSFQEIAEEFSRKFVPLTTSQVKAFCHNNKIKTGRGGWFVKGQPSWNKGKHIGIHGRMRETMFKKGNRPWNYKPIGSERINVEGYTEVKTKDPRTWRLKQRIVYEEYFGKIPKGYIVTFKDGDKQNFDPDNLAAISQAENVRMNQLGICHPGKEMWDTAILIARLQIANCRRKEERDDNHR